MGEWMCTLRYIHCLGVSSPQSRTWDRIQIQGVCVGGDPRFVTEEQRCALVVRVGTLPRAPFRKPCNLGKESACNARDLSLNPGSGRSPGEGHGNPLQYSCLENSMDRGACQATVHGVTKSQTWLSDFHFLPSSWGQVLQLLSASASASAIWAASPKVTSSPGQPRARDWVRKRSWEPALWGSHGLFCRPLLPPSQVPLRVGQGFKAHIAVLFSPLPDPASSPLPFAGVDS